MCVRERERDTYREREREREREKEIERVCVGERATRRVSDTPEAARVGGRAL